MPTQNSAVRFKYGTKAQYNTVVASAVGPDSNTWYICSDSQEIYIGNILFGTGSIITEDDIIRIVSQVS